jgi:hypothetical protein
MAQTIFLYVTPGGSRGHYLQPTTTQAMQRHQDPLHTGQLTDTSFFLFPSSSGRLPVSRVLGETVQEVL